MLRYFSSAYLSRYVSILFIIVIFWVPSFFIQQTAGPYSEPIFLLLFHLAQSFPIILIIAAFILTLLSSLIVNQMTSEFEFSNRFSTLGIFFFILFTSSLLELLSFNPFLIANIFLLFYARYLFKLPFTNIPITIAFNAGILLSLASLFFPPLLVFIFLLWASLFIHRLNDWRNYASSLIGLTLPYLFLFTFYLWDGSLSQNYEDWLNFYVFIPLTGFPDFSFSMINIAIFLFIIFISIINTLARLREKNINLRRNLMITIFYFLLSMFIAIFYRADIRTILIAAIPASLLLTSSVLQTKMKIFNLAVTVLFFLILVGLYLNLFKQYIPIF